MSERADDGSGLLTRPLMFLSSYAPLLLILAIRFEDLWLRITCFVLAAVGFLGLLVWIRLHRQPLEQQGRHTLRTVRGAGEGASSYLASYLLPFVTIGSPSVADLLAYFVFFCVAYLVTTRTGIIQVNPTLFLVGYRIDAITDAHGVQRYMLRKAKQEVPEDGNVRASRMTSGILIFEGVFPTDEELGTS